MSHRDLSTPETRAFDPFWELPEFDEDASSQFLRRYLHVPPASISLISPARVYSEISILLLCGGGLSTMSQEVAALHAQ